MATEREQASRGIDRETYKGAVRPGLKFERSELKAALQSTTPGGGNTLLHLAASVGNTAVVEELLKLSHELGKAANAQGNTALHLAAQGGFSKVVEILLQQRESGVDVCNKHNETALFKACESGDVATVKLLFNACPSSLPQKTADERTCLHAAINREDSDLMGYIIESTNRKDLIQEKYKNGDTPLHIAARRNDGDIIWRLIEIEPQLCYGVNGNEETPLSVAVKLGHLEAVQELIKGRPDAVEIPNTYGMNVLHLAAQVSQVRIVDFLNENVGLLDLVNRGLDKPPEEELGREETDPTEKKDPFFKIRKGDTPLHIAARKKNFNMVSSLLRIRGINKLAINEEGLTALDIARENTQYHESDKIISKLAGYPPRRKPFLYSCPKVSAEKHEVAVKMVDKTFDDRRNTELVVAVLLATMSFTAAFTVPGGFEEGKGSPLLLGLDTFKLFLIFDCVAFFLSLFAVLMWQMSTPITTGNKVLFLCVTNLLVCATFAFTAYGFMLAVYAMLAETAPKLGWVVLGSCLFICTCANFTFFYMVAKFSLTKARFNYLNGIFPYHTDQVGEWVWMKLEKWGPLDWMRKCKSKCSEIFLNCKCHTEHSTRPKRASRGSNNNV